ncbi:uncharacterized protein FA14DRAFT_190694 [Meira miltonrushii]|uniref:TFIIS N-terminal domain-containing protein n=1 Tax=Meira miltonrushii TaxID=1280837 RepID=A0A316V7Q1_9BASI|nr:uncharacterized protein FA14DRAFT_190694 [Meira miltonrushii]PWN33546.1 hypothetical protein FA14DRAFT_190694 [Meira miltonrushii]
MDEIEQAGTISAAEDEEVKVNDLVAEDEEEAIVPRKRQLKEGNNDDDVADEYKNDEDDDGDLFGEEGEASQSAPAKKKKKRSNDNDLDVDGGEDGGRPMTDQERRRSDMMRRIDAAAKGPKRPKKKKADETDLEQMADDEVNAMREKMLKAAQDDQNANLNGSPATAKLRMLREAVDTLQKTDYQQAILDNNLLEAVCKWLEPLEGTRSLPSLNIQRAFFPLLETMYIDTTSLKMSGLGKLMLFYTKKKGVDKNIRRIAERLIESWSRPILKRSSSYRDRQQAIREYNADGTVRNSQRTLASQKAAAQAASQASIRARIPESVTGNAFRYAPVSSLGNDLDDSQLSRLAEKQKINRFKRNMLAAKR